MHEGESNSIAELTYDSIINSGIAIAEGDGTNAHEEIDILITIDIPDMGAQTGLKIFRSDTFDILTGSFCESLSNARDKIQSPVIIFI
jgi:hypothetical protein